MKINVDLEVEYRLYGDGLKYILDLSQKDGAKLIPFYKPQNELEKSILETFKKKWVVFDNSKTMVVRRFDFSRKEEIELLVFRDGKFDFDFTPSENCLGESTNIMKMLKHGDYALFYSKENNEYVEFFDGTFKLLNKTGECIINNIKITEFFNWSNHLKQII